MATLRQIIVDTDSSYPGYDYATLQDAEDNEQDNISAATGTDEYMVFNCYATSGTADAYTNFDGWTTEYSGQNYIEVITSGVNYRHGGEWDTNTYTIYHDGGINMASLRTYEDHFRVTGLQIWMNNSSGTRRGFITASLSASDGEIIVSYCLVRGNGGSSQNERGIGLASGVSGQVQKIYNNIVFDISTAGTSYGIYSNADSGSTTYIYNNTVIGGTYGIYRNGGTVISIDNLCQDQVTQGVGTSAGVNAADGYNVIEDPTIVLQSLSGTDTDLKTGTATSYGANQLNDSGGGLSVAVVGSTVGNTTDSTYGYVTVVDSDNQLTLNADIFDTGNEAYRVTSNIYGSVSFSGTTYLLASDDTVAMENGFDLSGDSVLPITDDILGTTRPK